MHLLVVIICEHLQMSPSQKVSMTGCFVSPYENLRRVSPCHNTFHKPGHLKQISNTRPIPIHIPKTQHPLQPFQAFFLFFSKHIFLSAAVKYNTTEQIPQRPHVFLLLDTNKKTKTGGWFFLRKEVD